MNSAAPLLFLLGLSSGVWLSSFVVLCLRSRMSAARRYLVWQTAFVIIAVGSPFAFLNARISIPVLPPRPVAAPLTAARPQTIPNALPGNPAVPASASFPATVQAQRPSWNLIPLAYALWLSGVGAILVRSIAGFLCLHGIRRRAHLLGRADADGRLSPDGTHGFRVHATPEISVPMAAGIFSPAVLLPDALLPFDDTHLRSILLHEVCHLRRGDVAVLALARLVLAVHWFNPLAWFALAQLRTESELSADDSATLHHVSPADYAESLLTVVRRLKAAGSPIFPVVEMALTSEIAPRLTRLLDAGLDRTAPSGRFRGLTVTCATLLAVAFLILRPVAAQSPGSAIPASDEKHPFIVRCVDESGQPVAGAEVYLYESPGKRLMYQGKSGQPEFAPGPLTTDKNGDAAFTLDRSGNEPFTVRIFARLPGQLAGGTYATEFPSEPAFSVIMHPSGRITGRVIVKGGTGLEGVKVRLLHWMLMSAGRYEGFSNFPSPDTASRPAFMEVKPGEDGHFELSDVPASASAAIAATGPGYGLSQALSLPGHVVPVTISLEREAVIEGVLRDAATGAPVPSAGITVRPNPHHYAPGDLIPFEAVTDSRGFYRIGGLSEGSYTITLDWTGTWTMQQVDADVRPGSHKIVDLTREKGTVAAGQVVEEGNGRPVPGVMISAVSGDPGGAGLDSSATKEDGRFSLMLPSGNSLLYVSSSPRGFAYPANQGRRVISIRAGKVVAGSLDISLRTDTAPAAKPAHASGRVVDEQGKPQANVLISMKFEALSPSNPLGSQGGPIDSTGPDGTYKVSLYPNCRSRASGYKCHSVN